MSILWAGDFETSDMRTQNSVVEATQTNEYWCYFHAVLSVLEVRKTRQEKIGNRRKFGGDV